jgi:hypothetical protein
MTAASIDPPAGARVRLITSLSVIAGILTAGLLRVGEWPGSATAPSLIPVWSRTGLVARQGGVR